MLGLKTLPSFHRPISLKSLAPTFPSRFPLHFLHHRSLPLPSRLHLSPSCFSSSPSSATDMQPVPTVEHVVLFKVRETTDPSKVDAMVANLSSLGSLGIASYLTAGPILHRRSAIAEVFGFTHMLLSRYSSKADLATYSAHPSHLAVVRENVFPICDDVMAVDWVSEFGADVPPSPGSLVRLTLAKPREGTAAAELVKAIDGVRLSVPDSVRMSFGQNFSPDRAKGYEVGFISVFTSPDEADAIDGKEEMEWQKEKIRPLLESVVVVDYLVPSPDSNL